MVHRVQIHIIQQKLNILSEVFYPVQQNGVHTVIVLTWVKLSVNSSILSISLGETYQVTSLT
jgi:hypothetical protein